MLKNLFKKKTEEERRLSAENAKNEKLQSYRQELEVRLAELRREHQVTTEALKKHRSNVEAKIEDNLRSLGLI